jgi:protein-S-isoprenylcysteine O-methyltransferase Ste14
VILFLKNLLFTRLVPGTVAVYIPLLIARPTPAHPGLFMHAIGTLLLTLGAVVYFWTICDFAIFGPGTPLPDDAPKRLVVRGLYRFVRNPMYIGVVMVILGWACVFASFAVLIYALGVLSAVHIFVIFYEEKKLKLLFEVDYDAYQLAVGRWLPRFRKPRL